jgi:hypothetical protein
MKPRLEPVPVTEEDFEILCYTWPGRDWRRDPLYPIGHSIGADRRDADRMLRIMTLGCRFCGSNSMHGEVHMPDCIYVIDPNARKVWLRKGAKIIE